MTHTKGPWKMRLAANGDIGIAADGTGIFIECFAEIRHSGENAREEARANACVVIAALELLDALTAFVRLQEEKIKTPEMVWPTWGTPLLDAARAAIAKAEGR